MAEKATVCRGCLLGLAVGDAMGYPVDGKTLEEIHRDYGPGGLMGYDLVNGYADVTSYTQLAAYTANGLLIASTRGQLRGKMAPFVRYVAKAQQEWSKIQHIRRLPESTLCWISHVEQLRRRMCMDTRMLDTLRKDALGTVEEPANAYTTPAALTASVCVGLFFHPERMAVPEVGRLGAEVVALTHGDPGAFLSGAWLAYVTAGVVQEGALPLREQFLQAAEAVAAQFGRHYPQAYKLREQIGRGVLLAKNGLLTPERAMEELHCETSPQVLAGAVYACLTGEEDFDRSMIVAVNHSGRSSAVGAVTGAILGAKLGEEALPEFYLECLEPAEELRTLAEDLAQGCPMDLRSRLFDDDWDHKYIQGEPVEPGAWVE
ncbi:MAG TPA: ADP-ribosylglycohydrolase family protein [Candidatus Faecousia intestinigallinarum]|nr:ADP-ribosylglycohydrolase family protein [Candidatus Faecousia intestinigallinarum]